MIVIIALQFDSPVKISNARSLVVFKRVRQGVQNYLDSSLRDALKELDYMIKQQCKNQVTYMQTTLRCRAL